MSLKALSALFCLAVRASAQSLPDAPVPQQLDQAVVHAGAVTIPSYAEWQKKKQEEYLRAKKAGENSDPGNRFNFNRNNNDAEKRLMPTPRFTTESLDTNLFRPTPRVTVGVGYADRDMIVQGRTMSHDVEKYGFVKLELSRPRDSKKNILWLPTATYTETETSPKQRVAREEYTRGLRELRP